MNMPLWFSNLIFWSAQVAVIVTAAGLLRSMLQIREPRILLVYWRSLLALSLLLPFLQPWHRPKPVAAVAASIALESVPSGAPPSATVSHWQFPSLESVAPVLGVVILAGIAVRLAILALGLLKLRQLRKTSSPIVSSSESSRLIEATVALINARAEFCLSANVDSPVTFGFAAPIVLLPERFPSLEPRFQSAIACHELLHVRRHDWAHHLAEEFLRAALWFHPAIAWVISRVRLTREQIVDLEVVSLTQARKPYLESLLEFTNARARIAAIPAPPFLAERQLVERIALMLKEVRMSRTRIVASLTAISCCLTLVVLFATWVFPLKAAPRAAQVVSDGGTAPILQRIEVKHHDFDAGALNDAAVNAEETRMNQLPERLTVEGAYDQAKADSMKKLLEDFWNDRGVTVEVRSTLTVSSPRYANLEFDVYKQTLLPGRLEGGINGGISSGIAQGVSGAVAGGVGSGVNGGVSGGVSGARVIRSSSNQDIPNVDVSIIWTDTVKRGPMMRQVRGLGQLVRAENSSDLVARVTVPESFAADLRPGENATIQFRPNQSGVPNGPIKGLVTRVGPTPSEETQTVDIALNASRQFGFTAGVQISATIDIEKLDNILYVGRPANIPPNSGASVSASVFKISSDGKEAERVAVKFGRASANTIEVLEGLQAGDKVILSDMSAYDSAYRIHLTDQMHLEKH
ncbi:MAG TPA: M56 family metallopeptidase [Candidatus Methylomirabilis sp.]|nr:M56 family metallopeptidase [Candidatus Methylomirabilis sp.]